MGIGRVWRLIRRASSLRVLGKKTCDVSPPPRFFCYAFFRICECRYLNGDLSGAFVGIGPCISAAEASPTPDTSTTSDGAASAALIAIGVIIAVAAIVALVAVLLVRRRRRDAAGAAVTAVSSGDTATSPTPKNSSVCSQCHYSWGREESVLLLGFFFCRVISRTPGHPFAQAATTTCCCAARHPSSLPPPPSMVLTDF